MKPSDAYAKMAHREIERVPIDELEGRVTSILLTPYPAGYPASDSRRAVQQDHRRLSEIRNAISMTGSPGFETDVHGLSSQENGGKWNISSIASRRNVSDSGPCHVRERRKNPSFPCSPRQNGRTISAGNAFFHTFLKTPDTMHIEQVKTGKHPVYRSPSHRGSRPAYDRPLSRQGRTFRPL